MILLRLNERNGGYRDRLAIGRLGLNRIEKAERQSSVQDGHCRAFLPRHAVRISARLLGPARDQGLHRLVCMRGVAICDSESCRSIARSGQVLIAHGSTGASDSDP